MARAASIATPARMTGWLKAAKAAGTLVRIEIEPSGKTTITQLAETVQPTDQDELAKFRRAHGYD